MQLGVTHPKLISPSPVPLCSSQPSQLHTTSQKLTEHPCWQSPPIQVDLGITALQKPSHHLLPTDRPPVGSGTAPSGWHRWVLTAAFLPLFLNCLIRSLCLATTGILAALRQVPAEKLHVPLGFSTEQRQVTTAQQHPQRGLGHPTPTHFVPST